MKLKNLFIAILFIGTLFSCSDDEPQDSSTPDSIIGAWTLTGVNYSGGNNFYTFEGEGSNYNGGLTFSENPNNFVGNSTFDVHVVTSVTGTEIQYEDDFENQSIAGLEGTWTLEGNQLTFMGDGVDETPMAISFSDNGNQLTLDGTTVRVIQGQEVPVRVIATYVK